MKLIEVIIKKFRNIIDSNIVNVENDITCFVGKNESGKTAFLHALYRLNPVRTNAKFIIEDNYPAWLEKKDKMQGINIEEINPITANFILEKDEIETINDIFGENIILSNKISLKRSYDNNQHYSINCDETKFLKNLLKELSFSQAVRDDLKKCKAIDEIKEIVENYEPIDNENEKEQESMNKLEERIESTIGEADSLAGAIYETIKEKIPKFIYFDKYSGLPYSVKIKEILEAQEKNLTDEQLTARSLLRMAAADDDYLLNPDYERRKRELENIANALTQDVLNYWSQNPDLRVNPDITKETVNTPNGQTTVVDELKIRIWDNKHSLSLPFTEHSTGFQWFFSFLAAFSEFEYSDIPLIILLDEPGLGLHGRAQADFLRFIEERLAIKSQVLYTTHSPFMIQPNHLERTRLVEEKDIDSGCKITDEIMTTDPDTLFPLQGALGYDLAQHLFISKNNLILEGTTDFTYIQIISDFLEEQEKESLLEDWTLVPVGGADLIPTFVALLGIHLDITVIIDARREGNQKLSNLANSGYLKKKRIITLNEITGTKLADIEDLFSIEDYLKIYNGSFRENIKIGDLTGDDQIVNQIARYKGVNRFNHGKPADYFLRNRNVVLDNLSTETINNFEKLFKRINETFE